MGALDLGAPVLLSTYFSVNSPYGRVTSDTRVGHSSPAWRVETGTRRRRRGAASAAASTHPS